jgi:hypothetical protein
MAYGKCGVITPRPNVVTNEFMFDLVLREASIDDVRHYKAHQTQSYLLRVWHSSSHRTFLCYVQVYSLENLVAKKQLFVPNERQHFKIKDLKKTA